MTIAERAPDYITFLTAEEWGRKLIHSMSPEKLNDPETFVHHTAGNPYLSWTGAQAMRELQRFSHNKGYATVAYDTVVHEAANGAITIMEGRGAARSAATLDRNEEGEAICLFGYFQPGHSLSARPTSRQLEGLAWGIAWMIERGWSADDTRILGHRDNPRHPGATSCPGDYLYSELPSIRSRVAAILNPPQPTPPPEGDDAMLVGYIKANNHNAVYRQWSNGTKTWVKDPGELAVYAFVEGKSLDQLRGEIKTMPNDAWMQATGVIVGPVPGGVDPWGVVR